MASQTELYKEALDTGVLVAQDLAILAKPWEKGVTAPSPLFDANGIVTGALSDFVTLGEVAKSGGAKITSDTSFNPIEGYGSRSPRRRLFDKDEGKLEFNPQEARRIAYQIQQHWDEGAFTRTPTGGWRARKSSATRPKYWTIFMLAEDVNDETGNPIWQWWHFGKMSPGSGAETNLATDSHALGGISLDLFEDGDYLYDLGVDGPGFAPIAAELGFESSPWLVTITGTPAGGTFTLTIGGRTTAPIAYDASTAAVKSALVALDDGYGSSDWTVTGSVGGPYTITAPYPGVLTADGSSLTGGTSPDVTVTAAP